MEAQQREIAQRVAALRDARGWTNEHLAREAGVATKTVSRVVNARHEPRGNTIRQIAKALGVTESDILGTPPAPLGLDYPSDGAGEVRALLEQQNANLARQTEILEELRAAVAELRSEQAAQRADQQTQRSETALLAKAMGELAKELAASRQGQRGRGQAR